MSSGVNLDLTLGAAFIGFLFSTVLYGINCGQVYHYYTTYRDDGRTMKALVLAVWVADTVASCFGVHSQWYYAVTKCAGNGCIRDVWSTSAMTIPQNFCSLLAKCFYVYRLWIFGRNKVTLILPILLFSALGISYSFLPIMYDNHLSLSNLDPSSPTYRSLRWRFLSSTVLLTFADVSITIGMYILLRASRERAVGSSKSLINNLITYTIVTGLLAMLVQILYIVVLEAFPGTFLFQGVYYVLGKVDVACMLAAVNCRQAVQARFNRSQTFHSEPSDQVYLTTVIAPPETMTVSYESR